MPSKVDAAQQWIRLRKKSVIAHWLYGGLCAVVAAAFFPAGLALLGIFGIWEHWNDKNLAKRVPGYLPQGDMDWWDAFFMAAVVFTVLFIFYLFGKITITWR